jgi:hypothetical protein
MYCGIRLIVAIGCLCLGCTSMTIAVARTYLKSETTEIWDAQVGNQCIEASQVEG